MNWRLVVIILLAPVFAIYWLVLEPVIVSKNEKVKKYRLHLGILVSVVFLSALFLLLGLNPSSVLLFVSIISLGVIISASLVKEEEKELKIGLKEKDLILWEGENVEIRKVGKQFIEAISESGEFVIPVEAIKNKGIKKLRKVLPRKVEFSLFFPVEIYSNLLAKLRDFLKESTYVLVSPEFRIEFISVALNEVEVKVTFFTEDLTSEQAFWEEFFDFLDKEKLSVNRILKHGHGEAHWW
ncbi:MAG: hypothetical protein ACPLN0_03875 [Candidatus Hydrothermia bacterium]